MTTSITGHSTSITVNENKGAGYRYQGAGMRFEELEVWRRSVALSADIYLAMKDLKDYGFKDQITRSSLSIPSNIAEGIERGSDNEVIRFCTIARGSCGELRTQIYIGMKIGYIDSTKGESWLKETIEISAMISGFIKFRQRKPCHD